MNVWTILANAALYPAGIFTYGKAYSNSKFCPANVGFAWSNFLNKAANCSLINSNPADFNFSVFVDKFLAASSFSEGLSSVPNFSPKLIFPVPSALSANSELILSLTSPGVLNFELDWSLPSIADPSATLAIHAKDWPLVACEANSSQLIAAFSSDLKINPSPEIYEAGSFVPVLSSSLVDP